ncbi:MAG TPA: PilZ domain-containing protein [Thermoanaerobaculia bacterium]|jgi:hypothetical protein
MGYDDRREFQRLKLAKPILATMNGQNALILDIGVAGAFLEHYGRVELGDAFLLVYRWQGEDVEFACEVVRSTVVRDPGGDGKSLVSHTGVHFLHAVGDSHLRLQEMMATFVGKILAAQRSNASGNAADVAGAAMLADLGGARRARTRGFTSYHLNDGLWTRSVTSTASQPDDGFTVAAYEDEDELETLCRAYEQADEEGRRLIRLVAELSVLSTRR